MRIRGLIIGGWCLALAAQGGIIERLDRGDFLTIGAIGTSLTHPESSFWLAQMGAWLNTRYPGKVTLVNQAVRGSASKYTATYNLTNYPGKPSGVDYQLDQALAQNPDAMFIEFSYNDSYTPYGISVAMANTNLQEMIDRINTWAAANGKTVDVVVQTMNIDPTPPGTSGRPNYPSYYQGYREVAAANGLLLVDNYPSWLNLYNSDRSTYDSYMSDAYHPNAAGNANVTLPNVQAALLGHAETNGAPTVGRSLLTAHWKLDEGAGAAASDSAGTNAGAVVGAPLWTNGLLGGALNFRGTNFTDGVRVANTASLNPSSITVSAWVRTADTNANRGVVDKVHSTPSFSGYWLDVGNGGAGRPRFGIRYGTLTANTVSVSNSTSVADNAWHLLTGVFADTGAVKTARLYVDGILKATVATNVSIKADTNALYIAGDGASTFRFNGAIDDVALWSGPLGAAEIRALHGFGIVPGLKLNAGQAQTLFDFFATAGPGSNTVVADRRWSHVSGLSGAEGAVGHLDGYYELRLAASGEGLRTPGMLSRWAFDEGAGQAAADSAYLNHGVLGVTTNAEGQDPAWTNSGRFGSALSFNGVSNRVIVANADSLHPPSLTVSAWVKTTDGGFARGIVDKVTFGFINTGYWLDLNYGRPRFGYRTVNGSITNTVSLSNTVSAADGAWHLLTATVADTGAVSEVKLYVDGALVSATVTNLKMRADTNSLYIGGDGASTLNISGTVDDVGLWDRALSPAETKAVHSLASHPALNYDLARSDRLLSLFRDGAGSTAIDGTNWYYMAGGLSWAGEGDVRDWGGGQYAVNLGGGAGVSMMVPPGGTLLILAASD